MAYLYPRDKALPPVTTQEVLRELEHGLRAYLALPQNAAIMLAMPRRMLEDTLTKVQQAQRLCRIDVLP